MGNAKIELLNQFFDKETLKTNSEINELLFNCKKRVDSFVLENEIDVYVTLGIREDFFKKDTIPKVEVTFVHGFVSSNNETTGRVS